MRKLRQLFHRNDNSLWPSPRESIGKPAGRSDDGRRTYWRVTGPAREVWKELGPNAKNRIFEDPDYVQATLIVEFYMFGATEDTAAPLILICCEDDGARRQAARAIERSGILLNQHPAIRLGQICGLTPKPLSQDEIELGFTHYSDVGIGTVVLTPPLDKSLGRRLFIPKQDGKTNFFRPVTAGPILYVNGKIYQLTVGHTFTKSSDFPLPQAGSKGAERQQGDIKKAKERGNSGIQLGLTDKSKHAIKRTWSDDNACNRPQQLSSSHHQCASMVGITKHPSLDSGVHLTKDEWFVANDCTVSRKLDILGKLAWLSDPSNAKSLDYALIELEEEHHTGSNQVPYEPNGSQRFLHVWQEAKGGPRDVRIVAMTASSGFMTGELCATASYVRFPNQRTVQELYPVILEGKLADGDCGSGVIDQATGHLYGHIVMGTAGTGQAYIVSAKDVFQDIKEKLGEEVMLIPPGQILEPLPEYDFKLDQLKPWKHKFEYKKRGDPSRVVEFASKKYFRNLGQPVQSNINEDKSQSLRTPPKSTSPTVLPGNYQVAGPSRRRSTDRSQPITQALSTQSNDSSHPDTGPLSQGSACKPRFTTAKSETKARSKDLCDLSKQKLKVLPFEERFFALPSDLQVNVVAYLCVPDILKLRQVSKNWLQFITVNETPISRAFLEHNRVPRFAVDLYPLPTPSDLDLYYISELWHRLSVTSKLSTILTDWITTDIFLRNNETQQLEFSPQRARIRRRLIPIIFTIAHFFETYCRLHLRHVLENGCPLLPENHIINPIERHIMKMYDNETLLQVHQFFPFLLSYLSRKLRPPSYFGRLERSLHGYSRSSLPPPVLVGILCIGGMKEVTRISKIESHDSRRMAVDDWYSAMFQQPIDYAHETYHWPLGLGQKKSKHLSSSAAPNSCLNQTCNSTPTARNASKSSKTRTSTTGQPGNTTSLFTNGQPPIALSDGPGDTKDLKGKGKQKASASSLSVARTQRLSAEHARALLKDLPTLEQIWVPTAEALLLARRATERWQDIKRNGQAMNELILNEFTAADELFYGCAEPSFDPSNVNRGWGDLLDGDGQEMGR
jgi:hypothetical protein